MQALISSQRTALLTPNHLVRPAHPAVADALCVVAERFADTGQKLWEALGVFVRRVFWTAFVVGSIGIFVANLFRLLP